MNKSNKCLASLGKTGPKIALLNSLIENYRRQNDSIRTNTVWIVLLLTINCISFEFNNEIFWLNRLTLHPPSSSSSSSSLVVVSITERSAEWNNILTFVRFSPTFECNSIRFLVHLLSPVLRSSEKADRKWFQPKSEKWLENIFKN